MNITEWIDKIINGPGGMADFERHEWVDWLDSDRYCAVSWALRCLANPACEGSEDVLQAILDRRAEVRARDQEKLAVWERVAK